MRVRLDTAMAARGLAASRSRARDLITRGCVEVEGQRVQRPSTMIGEDVAVTVDAAEGDHVSRGALKLAHGLDAFGLSPAGRVVLDLGASTGGFTQVLLAQGAQRVHAIDVGHDQLHATLRCDPRVVVHEKCDARTLTAGLIPDPVNAIVADVSFISLTKVLAPAFMLALPGTWLVALIKPQFEVGPKAVGKGGIVRDDAARRAAIESVETWIAAQAGWRVAGITPSPIKGGSGNIEMLIGATFDGR